MLKKIKIIQKKSEDFLLPAWFATDVCSYFRQGLVFLHVFWRFKFFFVWNFQKHWKTEKSPLMYSCSGFKCCFNGKCIVVIGDSFLNQQIHVYSFQTKVCSLCSQKVNVWNVNFLEDFIFLKILDFWCLFSEMEDSSTKTSMEKKQLHIELSCIHKWTKNPFYHLWTRYVIVWLFGSFFFTV